MTEESVPVGEFAALYRELAPSLKRLAFLLTGSDAAAEDAVHEVFVRCAPRLSQLEHPPSYLRTAVVNECRSQYRRRRSEPLGLPRHDEIPHEVLETLAALEQLGARKRAAVVLRFFADLPEAEIADVLGCRPSTVRSLVRRALIDLREVLHE